MSGFDIVEDSGWGGGTFCSASTLDCWRVLGQWLVAALVLDQAITLFIYIFWIVGYNITMFEDVYQLISKKLIESIIWNFISLKIGFFQEEKF